MAQREEQLIAQLHEAHKNGNEANARAIAQELISLRQRQAQAATLPMAPQSFQALDASTMQQIKLAAGYFLNLDPEARKDMIQRVLGDGVVFDKDDQGRDIVTFGTERAYLNKPGFDANDALSLSGELVKYAPAGRLAAWLGAAGRGVLTQGAGLTRTVTGGMVASAATQAASEAASGALGSEQGVSPLNAAVAAGGGAAGELVGAAVRGTATRLPFVGDAVRFNPEAQQALREADALGIDLRGQPGAQVNQLQQAAGRMGAMERGHAMPAIAEGVRNARETERKAAGALFDQARQTRAYVSAESTVELRSRVAHALGDFDLGAPGMSTLRRQLRHLDELADESVPFDRKLVALETWRRRMRAMTPKDGSPAEAATKRAIQVYDHWLDDMFNADMIKGDATAIEAWKTARAGWAMFKQRFDADRVVRDLARKDTTPEQMARWLFNTSAVGAKAEAGATVRRLNDILGADSDAMKMLRAEVVMDLVEPLFRDVPDAQGFVHNYVKFVRDNPTLNSHLFPGETGTELRNLALFAREIGMRPGARVEDLASKDAIGEVLKFFTRIGVGHGIAKGGARITATNAAANYIRRVTTGSAARVNILRGYLGIEPERSLFRGAGTTIGAANTMTEPQ